MIGRALGWLEDRRTLGFGLLVATTVWFTYAIITELTVSYQRGNNESDYWVICSSSLAIFLVIALLARDPREPEVA